ncbi:MAG: hypothetical protein ACRDJL_03565 [Actinomycetota bacterium]
MEEGTIIALAYLCLLNQLGRRHGNHFYPLPVPWGMAMNQRRSTSIAAALAVSLLLTACSDNPRDPVAAGPDKPEVVTSAEESDRSSDLKAPPPVTVRFFDQSIDLHAWTYCYGNGCVDGVPPRNPSDVGDPEAVVVEFPLSGWSFKASFTPVDEKCGRIQTVSLEPTDEGEFVLRPAGRADTYDVTLFGGGNGDLFTTFRWSTPDDGPLPKPGARLAVLAGHDGAVDSYGVELEVRNLARTPRSASAWITVRAEDGDALTFKAKQSHRGCFPGGTLCWDGPDDKGLAAAELGDGPFSYDVELSLEGKRYVASATWPDEEIKGNEPSVRLDFSPSLPALPE